MCLDPIVSSELSSQRDCFVPSNMFNFWQRWRGERPRSKESLLPSPSLSVNSSGMSLARVEPEHPCTVSQCVGSGMEGKKEEVMGG